MLTRMLGENNRRSPAGCAASSAGTGCSLAVPGAGGGSLWHTLRPAPLPPAAEGPGRTGTPSPGKHSAGPLARSCALTAARPRARARRKQDIWKGRGCSPSSFSSSSHGGAAPVPHLIPEHGKGQVGEGVGCRATPAVSCHPWNLERDPTCLQSGGTTLFKQLQGSDGCFEDLVTERLIPVTDLFQAEHLNAAAGAGQ